MDYLSRTVEKSSVKKRNKVIFSIIILLIILIVSSGLSLAWFGYNIAIVRGEAAENFTVEAGAGVNEISQDLHQTGIIRSQMAFETFLYLRNLEGSLKAGVYQLPSVTISELTSILLQGPPPPESRATLIEGWTLKQYADNLAELGIVDRDVFLDKVQHPVTSGFTDDKFPILYSRPTSVDLEGYLFPDTYRFFTDVTEDEIISGMINNLTSKITEEMAIEIEVNRGLTMHEILTMASIIEKEVNTDRDRRLASGVLWKRIGLSMPLQVDASINYITGQSKLAVTLAETQIDNPFNTYLYKGLPPGPIANPGLSSILAAIYPTESDYLYYLSNPAGETIFSETLEQHNEAKAKYLKD